MQTQTEFLAEESKIAEKHLKKLSTSLSSRGMKIKTTLRFYFIPVRLAEINNTIDSS